MPNILWARKSFWMHPMELLGDVGQVEACIGVLGHCDNLDARYVRYVHSLHRMYHRLINYFGHF
jgi:hypothetical protein